MDERARAFARGMGRAAALVALALVLDDCRRQPLPAPDLVARLGQDSVRYPEFEHYLIANLGESGASLSGDVLSGMFDQFLDEKVVQRLAVERGAVSPSAPARVALEALLEPQRQDPTELEIAAYYHQHEKDFMRPERVRLRQILTVDRPSAERALAALASGDDFGAVARRWSRDPSASRGGDQGELSRDDLPPSLAEAIFRLAPGEVSPIIPAEYGFHVFLVVERHPAELAALEEVSAEVRGLLLGAREDEHHAALVAAARSRYNAMIYERNLPFTYRGQYPVVPAASRGAL